MPVVLKEFLRVLKPDGFLVITEKSLTTALQAAGFQTIAGKRRLRGLDLWVVASKSAMTDEVIRELAGKVLPG